MFDRSDDDFIEPGFQNARLERRRFLQWLMAPALLALLPSPVWAASLRIAAARFWPSNEYSRLTLESTDRIPHRLRLLKNPDRLVIDLENFAISPALQKMAQRVTSTHDRYLKSIRFGAPEPGNLRMVLDLREPIQPQAFALAPIADYQHRLVIDLYPLVPYDPLLALLEQEALQHNLETPKLGASAKRSSLAKDKMENGRTSEANALPSNKADKVTDKPSELAIRTTSSGDTLEDLIARATQETPSLPTKLKSAETKSSDKKAKSPGLRKNSGTFVVAIDPGHGGEDPGAVGQLQTYEKNVTLSIGRKLRTVLEHHPNIRTIMTRDDDYFVPLQQRVQKARRVKADLFVSIHADAFTKPSAKGSSVFVLSENGASSAAAKWLAQKENAADLIGGLQPAGIQDASIARLLLDMSQTATINDSLKLAQAVLKEMGEINTLHKNQVEQAGFAVLKAPDIPSILVETAFISNPEEEQKLRDDGHQEKVARAIKDGIQAYALKHPRLAAHLQEGDVS